MTEDQYKILLASIKAQELVLRGLFTKWALEADDPRASAFRMIEGMIGSIQATATKQEVELGLIELIEEELRQFAANIDTRLAGEGYPN